MTDQSDQSAQPEHGEPGSEIEQDQTHQSRDQARDQAVIDDEKEAMRRAKLPKPGNDAPEAENPKIAEIESVLAAIRH